MSGSEHKGHRLRLKNKFLQYGLDSFQEHEILELALFYTIPLKDTNELAHRLIDKFGSLSNVFDASYDSLKTFGLTDNTITFVKFIPAVCCKYLKSKTEYKAKVLNLKDIIQILGKLFIDKREENVALMLLDSGQRLIYSEIVSKGTITGASFDIKVLIELALKYNAHFAVIAHNHPSDFILPSTMDLEVTRKVMNAFDSINIKLVDHLVFGKNEVFSILKENVIEYKIEF